MRWLFVLLLVACRQAPPAGAAPAPAPSDGGARGLPLPAPASIPWRWDHGPDLFPHIALTDGAHTLALEKKKLVLHGPTWSVAVAGGGEFSGAALAADGGRVFVAFYNRGAAGCQLAGFDGASGKQLWSTTLDGIGPIGHSKYSNRVQISIIGGQPTVFGSEAKRYIEQRDAATGALVSHQLFPADYQPVPLAEYLFYELDLMLRKQATYTFKVNDFLSRHASMKSADHAARGAAFAEAVRQLDRLGRFEIRLVDSGDDFDLTARRAVSGRSAPRPP